MSATQDVEFILQFIIGPEIRPYGGPLFFTRTLDASAGKNVIANGAFGLVDTGEKKLLVTCHHVWKRFQDEHRSDPNVRLCVCLDSKSPVVFDENEPIDQDERLDLATFDITRVLAACYGRRFYNLGRNPAPPVTKGTQLVLLGPPGMFRSATDTGLEFGVMTYALEVSSVDGWRFHADISKARTRRALPPAGVPRSSPHAGISGSPCFLIRDERPSELVGFATGHLRVEGADYLCFTHARCLRPDGTIRSVETSL